MKTIVAAVAALLLTLSSAHAGGFLADAIRLVPSDVPETGLCWPKAPVDPRIFEIIADVSQFQAPNIRECLDWPQFPPGIDFRINHELPRDLSMYRWMD